ncbi:hypothetical protein [Streptacidiphilus sp. P02-A3a]|uniref:hypothetical protein n=1 Tax=Streptacidiphilus sp. P02-A3a TaxID=2704468 RepID=UPI0015FB3DCE|nr:hypothetical protein [Streptacidiphilus sp. P02-A3a]QMU66832.1 hypothetical protein GXP74_36575 [Streptacidiphilus sp. P02-A3a]
MPQHLRHVILGSLCAMAVVGLAACSSSATSASSSASAASSSAASSGSPAAGASASATKGAAAADPNAGLPSGTELAAMLLPADAVPSPLKPDSSGTRNSGSVFAAPSTAAVPTSQACAALGATSWINAAGIESGSFAQNDYTDSYSDMFAQEVDAFRGGDATTVMAHLRHVFTECGTFKFTQGGSSYPENLSWKTLPGVGDQAFKAVITSPDLDGGTTLVAVRVGDLVATTLYNDQNTTGSAGVALTERLAKNLG